MHVPSSSDYLPFDSYTAAVFEHTQTTIYITRQSPDLCLPFWIANLLAIVAAMVSLELWYMAEFKFIEGVSQTLVLYDHVITFEMEVSRSTYLRDWYMLNSNLEHHQVDRIWTWALVPSVVLCYWVLLEFTCAVLDSDGVYPNSCSWSAAILSSLCYCLSYSAPVNIL